MYSLLGLLSVLSTLFFFRLFYFNRSSRRELAGYIFVNIAGTFTHYWFFFLLAAQGVAYLWLLPKSSFKSFAGAMLVSVFPFFALWTPALLYQMTNGGTSAIHQPGFLEFFATLSDFYGGGIIGALVYAAALAVVLVQYHGAKLPFRPPAALKAALLEKQTLALLLLLSLSLLVPLVMTQFTPIWMKNRYAIIALHPASVLLGFFLARFGRRVAVGVFVAVLLASASAGFVHKRSRPAPFTYKSAYDGVARRSAPGDVWIMASTNWVGIRYYQRLNKTADTFQNFSFPSEMFFHPSWSTTVTWSEETGRLAREADSLVKEISSRVKNTGRRVWLIAGYHPVVNGIIKDRLDRHFDPVEEFRAGPGTGLLGTYVFPYKSRETGPAGKTGTHKPSPSGGAQRGLPSDYSRSWKMSYASAPAGGYGDWMRATNSNFSGKASTTRPTHGCRL
jgi:hypothetical protein